MIKGIWSKPTKPVLLELKVHISPWHNIEVTMVEDKNQVDEAIKSTHEVINAAPKWNITLTILPSTFLVLTLPVWFTEEDKSRFGII